MGQYYKPINLANGQWLYSHDYGSGLKLMEHSWIGNNFVGAVMKLMTQNGQWHKKPIVWCGDYYEKLPDSYLVGTWARDVLSVEFEIPDGYTELNVAFKE